MDKFKSIKLRSFLVGISFIFMIVNSFSAKKVVLFHGNYTESVPKNIAANINYIETMPLDGIVILPAPDCDNVMKKGGVVTYTSVYDNNLKLTQGIFKKFNYNWAAIFTDKPGDFFNNAAWNVVINNWRMFARACKAAGLVGIYFDNEEYHEKIWDYPAAVDSSSKYTLEQYRAQARLRGKQCMQACIEEYPNIEVTCIYGAYISEPRLPGWFLGFNYGALMGAFVVGMTEATVGNQAFVHDGGEVYKYRTQSQFTMSYNWRKDTIATDAHNSPNIPTSLRPYWKQKVKISQGLYTETWPDANYPMNPTIMRSCMEYALRACDDYVWLFPDWPQNWLIPPGTNAQPWLSAIAGARLAVNSGLSFNCATTTVVSAGSPFAFTISYENFTGSPASLVYTKKPSWITATNGNPAISGTAPTTSRIDTLTAIVSAGTKADTLNLSITIAQYFIFEAEQGTIQSPMQIIKDPAASNGQYITTPAGTGNTINPKTEAAYSFNAPQTGTYYVWLLTFTQTINPAANYGTFVGFNGTFTKPGAYNINANQYEWVMYPKSFNLAVGSNQLILGHGNEQIRIDKIIITNSSERLLPEGVTGLISKNKTLKNPQKLNLNIHPNTIDFIGNFGNPIQLKVVDIMGRKVWSYNNEEYNNAGRIVWDNSKVSNGMYFVFCESQKGYSSEIQRITLAR